MGQIELGRFSQVATDQTMATAARTPGSSSQQAIDERVKARVADEIAADGTVAAAAAAAVTNEITGRSIVEARKQLGTQNLTAVTTVGQYLQGTPADGTLARGYPAEPCVGTLEVIPVSPTSSSVIQRFTRWITTSGSGVYGETESYERLLASGFTGTWRRRSIAPSSRNLGTRDLNTVLEPAQYLQTIPAEATIARHYPIAGVTGTLEVMQVNLTGNTVIQRYTVWTAAGDLEVWQRIVGAVSGAWQRITGSGGGGTTEVSRVVLLAGAGQSNLEGRGRPYSAELDPTDPRIVMWDWASSSLQDATVPLSSRLQRSGLSILTVMAREILARDALARVVIVNGGVGGSGLVAASPNGRWDITDASSLYPAFKSAVSSAVNAATVLYGVPVEVVGVWHQGEQDATATTTTAAYQRAFQAIWDDFRGVHGQTPIVIGGMVPEYAAANKSPITAALVGIPAVISRTAYVPGPWDGCGSQSPTDTVHYHRGGVLALGRAMHDALPRAYANESAQQPHAPTRVRAEVIGGQLALSWEYPLTRVTSFTPEYRVDGGAWQAISHPTLDTTATAPITAGNVLEARVTATNEVGTSPASRVTRCAIL